MKNYIIGIAGAKNSGKDTVASMINYIFGVGISKANYSGWILHRSFYDNNYKDRIIHFADTLKDVLSLIYNIPREVFDNRQYKDELWYCFETSKFVEINNRNKSDYYRIDTEDIKHFSFKYCRNRYSDKPHCIKLRTLMQYFGTDVCREYLDEDIWINSAIYKIVNKAEERKLCIVPDIRFNNEAEAIKNDSDSLYGGVILIKRGENTASHISEDIDFETDFTIDNNGTLMQLFFKVLEIIQKI